MRLPLCCGNPPPTSFDSPQALELALGQNPAAFEGTVIKVQGRMYKVDSAGHATEKQCWLRRMLRCCFGDRGATRRAEEVTAAIARGRFFAAQGGGAAGAIPTGDTLPSVDIQSPARVAAEQAGDDVRLAVAAAIQARVSADAAAKSAAVAPVQRQAAAKLAAQSANEQASLAGERSAFARAGANSALAAADRADDPTLTAQERATATLQAKSYARWVLQARIDAGAAAMEAAILADIASGELGRLTPATHVHSTSLAAKAAKRAETSAFYAAMAVRSAVSAAEAACASAEQADPSRLAEAQAAAAAAVNAASDAEIAGRQAAAAAERALDAAANADRPGTTVAVVLAQTEIACRELEVACAAYDKARAAAASAEEYAAIAAGDVPPERAEWESEPSISHLR